MNIYKKTILLWLVAGLGTTAFSQETIPWSLQKCLDYAHKNNLQIQQANIRIQESELSKKQSIAGLFPSITASASMGLSRQNAQNTMNEYMSDNSVNARYNVSANMILFNGLKQYNNIKQQELNIASQNTNLEEIVFNTDLSIIQAYTQIAYLKEALEVLKNTLKASESQLEMATSKLKAGSISQSDHAQIAAQFSSDQYQVIRGENQLNEQLLKLKQLLELDMDNAFQVADYSVEEDDILSPLPDKRHIYEQALLNLPSSRQQEINVQSAELDYKMATAGYFPTLSLSASVGTGNWFDADRDFGSQLSDNLNESINLSLSVPIFNGWQTRTSVQKARLNRENVRLNKTTAEKELLSTIETLYNDAVAAQSQYRHALSQVEAAESSHSLVSEQFKLGLKDAVELLVSENNRTSAQENLLQCKYTAALAIRLLHYYQGQPIE